MIAIYKKTVKESNEQKMPLQDGDNSADERRGYNRPVYMQIFWKEKWFIALSSLPLFK